MTVENLIKFLSKHPAKMEVYIKALSSDFGYAPVETVVTKYVSMSEEPGGEPLSREEVLVLSDEI